MDGAAIFETKKFNSNLYTFESSETSVLCYNCGEFHITQNCPFPDYIERCYRCHVTSFDGSGHKSPCSPINKIIGLRANIYALPLMPMFKIKMPKNEGTFYYLNSTSCKFENMVESNEIMSGAEGVFTFKRLTNNNVLLYEACQYRRFSVGIGVFSGGKWRLRFRLVTTAKQGLLVFKQFSTLLTDTQLASLSTSQRVVLPTEHNNVLIFGIKPIDATPKSFRLDLRIFANGDGVINNHEFNSIDGSLQWAPGVGKGEYTIDPIIDAGNDAPKESIMFSKELYYRS